ncbi:MAG: uroporphyrinogen-III C-methyltransferase [Gammaproteobacteria bacterium]|jgi:uncharacterized protein HemX|nr:uroporphyrinogen-III C-methyltransferase [Gammaproteobacteria bacterium]
MSEDKPQTPDTPETGSEPQPEPATDEAQSGNDPGSQRGSGTAWLAMLVALVAAAGAGYALYGQFTMQRQQQAGRSELEARLGALGSELQKDQASSDSAQAQLRSGIEDVTRRQAATEQAIDGMQAELGRERQDWMLEEARQLVVVASQRLQLAHDQDTAIAALRAADARLKELGDPSLLEVRRQLAADIARLETTERVDLAGMALRVHGLAGAVASLPLATRAEAPGNGAPAPAAGANTPLWERVGENVWQDLKGLVRFREYAASRPPLLPPSQEYFLRENLRLMLAAAELALLQRESAVFRSKLQTAAGWLRDHFDLNSETVTQVLSQLDELAGQEIDVALPDITASLRELEKHIGSK